MRSMLEFWMSTENYLAMRAPGRGGKVRCPDVSTKYWMPVEHQIGQEGCWQRRQGCCARCVCWFLDCLLDTRLATGFFC